MFETDRTLLQRTASRLASWASSQGSSPNVPLMSTIETIAETAIAGGYGAGFGIGLALPIKSAVTLTFGHADLADNIGVNDRTSFAVGACARQFTAVATLLLAERNMVRLTDHVSRFLPDLPGVQGLRLDDLLWGDDDADALLRRIVASVSGQSYKGFVADHLLAPAGMNSSFFADGFSRSPFRATGYRLADGRAHDFLAVSVAEEIVAPADFFTTAADLLLWNRALFNRRLLTPLMMDMITAPQGDSHECSPALAAYADRHATGFGIHSARLFGRRAFWQRGQTPGFDAWLFHFPDERMDLALVANTEDGATTILEPVLRAVLRL